MDSNGILNDIICKYAFNKLCRLWILKVQNYSLLLLSFVAFDLVVSSLNSLLLLHLFHVVSVYCDKKK